MEGVRSKVITAVLSAVLIFNVAVPIPIGVKPGCDFRYEEANANEAVVAGGAAFVTWLIACGFYLTADNVSDFGTAAELAWNDLATFADQSGIMDAATLQGVLESAVLGDGKIVLDVIQASPAYSLLSAWANSLISGGEAGIGDSSTSLNHQAMTIRGINFETGVQKPYYADAAAQAAGYGTIYSGYIPAAYTELENGTAELDMVSPTDTVYLKNRTGLANGIPYLETTTDCKAREVYVFKQENGQWVCIGNYRRGFQIIEGLTVINALVNWDVSGTTPTEQEVTPYPYVVTQSLVDGTSAPTGTYDAYTPTDESLANGLDLSALVESVNSGTEVATDISGSVSQILLQITGISGAFGNLSSQVQTLVSDFASMLAWAGAENFPTVMNTVIDGLGDISGGIEEGVSDLLDGLADIPGADVLSPTLDGILDGINELVNPVTVDIPAVLEGVQEGVLSIPDAIEVGLADVISAVNAQTLDITGAIESAISPFLRNFNVPEGDGTPIALPGSVHSDLEMALEDKVPFCYVIRSQDALNNMFTSFASNRSFYFDVQLPYAEDTIRFDAEPFLSQPFGAFDIATTLKIIFTALLCFGLLWRSYKMIERLVM